MPKNQQHNLMATIFVVSGSYKYINSFYMTNGFQKKYASKKKVIHNLAQFKKKHEICFPLIIFDKILNIF